MVMLQLVLGGVAYVIDQEKCLEIGSTSFDQEKCLEIRSTSFDIGFRSLRA